MGAVVSEQPLGVRPDPRSFPWRKRLISGLSLGSVVIEAAEGSGACHTVYHALEQDQGGILRTGQYLLPGQRFHQPDDQGRRQAGDGNHRYIRGTQHCGDRSKEAVEQKN